MLIGVDASRALRARQTGTERYAFQIIDHLLRLPAAADHNWRLYTGAEPGPLPFPLRTPGASSANVQVRVLPARRLWTHRALAREVLRQPPDVLFVPAHVIPFVLPPQRLPPAVVTIHDLGYLLFPAAHTRSQRWYLDWSTRWSAHAAARVIAISRATAQDLAHFYGVDRRKIDVIYEATVPLLAPPAVGGTPPWQPSRPYALFVGTIQPRKNLVRLAQAYARLRRTHAVGWDLVLAGGEGWLSQPVIDQIDSLGLPDCIHRLGYVADGALEPLLRNALFFCYVSLYEGFGLPVLEAQMHGAPVMTANNSSLPEVAGDAALLVDPLDVDAIADAMLRLSQDEALRQQLIAAGYANVARFSWETAARQTLDVLLAAALSGRRP
jgi:glycosyltransferase involved in cell wall biosynthesis